MYVRKSVLLLLLVAGVGTLGWYLYLSSGGVASSSGSSGRSLSASLVRSSTADAPPSVVATSPGVYRTSPGGAGNTVIARNGAIVFIGDNGVLKANTGDTSSSGAVVIDSSDSDIASGGSSTAPEAGLTASRTAPTASQARLTASHTAPTASQARLTASHPGPAASEVNLTAFSSKASTGVSGTAPTDASGTARTDVSRPASGSPAKVSGGAPQPSGGTGGKPGSGSASQSDLAPNLGNRAVGISGYENHSVNIAGDDQIATYDDSNVFIDREGKLNANTGDTDSSGLNAVDVTGSVARSGDSSDDGSADGADDATATDASQSAATQASAQAAQSQEAQQSQETQEPEESPQAQDSEDATAATTAADPASSSRFAPASLKGNANGTASSVDPDASTSATGRNPLVIGGDGYDDLSIRSSGNRNVVSYDDSNVVIGGRGDVNAQIGDSDTGGAVVMGIHGSHVEAGASS
ncbi:MAG TPA: hypothetical protein VGJ07_19825 [Rugosimonospora sp.]